MRRIRQIGDQYIEQEKNPLADNVHYLNISNTKSKLVDFRVSIAIDKDIKFTTQPNEWKTKREKTRKSFSFDEQPWHLDATEVTEIDQFGKKRITYEVEFEFETTFLQSTQETCIRNGDFTDIKSLIEKFWAITDALIEECNEKKSPFVLLPETESHRLREICNGLLDRQRSDEFPGSMPINFNKCHLLALSDADCMVSDKTDGIRYFLLVHKGEAYLANRRYQFFRLSNFRDLCSVCGDDPSLFDGEMVDYLREPERKMFLIFDVMAINGEAVWKKPLLERLNLIYEKLILPLRQRTNNSYLNCPFMIDRKIFFEKRDLNQLLVKISSEKTQKGLERIYRDDKRKHKIDGLIFTPKDPYKCKSTPNLLKWKYLDRLSVDMRIERTDSFRLFAEPNTLYYEGNHIINYQKLEQDFAQRMSEDTHDSIVGEFSFDTQGNWIYNMMRPDKNRANHIKVVEDTIEVISQNVQINDIVDQLK
eukprot:TRINITY_DN7859_c0_g1_i1.p1 TRINITY_DN7859_c0_g1~~TRINITY_DN7859_c0_g1_i1.p1  ORF type:complete len:487 (-),score=111.86 TRINITY_DN7859_c0_g1_i1:1-1434(-)